MTFVENCPEFPHFLFEQVSSFFGKMSGHSSFTQPALVSLSLIAFSHGTTLLRSWESIEIYTKSILRLLGHPDFQIASCFSNALLWVSKLKQGEEDVFFEPLLWELGEHLPLIITQEGAKSLPFFRLFFGLMARPTLSKKGLSQTATLVLRSIFDRNLISILTEGLSKKDSARIESETLMLSTLYLLLRSGEGYISFFKFIPHHKGRNFFFSFQKATNLNFVLHMSQLYQFLRF